METNEQNLNEAPVKKSAPAAVGILVLMGCYIVGVGILQLLVALAMGIPIEEHYTYTLTQDIMLYAASLVGVLLSTWFVLRCLDKRSFTDLGLNLKGRGMDLVGGLVVAAVIYAVGFLILLLCRAVTVEGVQVDFISLGSSFVLFILVALSEEIMVRGYVLGRLLRTRLNKFVSLGISSVLFALLHTLNPNVASLPMLNLVLAGFLLGASYLYTRNLWFPISLHLFWNWIQGGVLGFKVSGQSFEGSLLSISLPESNWLNGGEFGFEGSILCTILTSVATVLIILYFERRQPS